MAISFNASISYNGTTKTVAPGEVATLPCVNTIMTDNVTVSTPDVIPAELTSGDLVLSYNSSTFELTASITNAAATENSIKYTDSAVTATYEVSDPNLVASNIRRGVTIFGVTGSYVIPTYNFEFEQ